MLNVFISEYMYLLKKPIWFRNINIYLQQILTKFFLDQIFGFGASENFVAAYFYVKFAFKREMFIAF